MLVLTTPEPTFDITTDPGAAASCKRAKACCPFVLHIREGNSATRMKMVLIGANVAMDGNVSTPDWPYVMRPNGSAPSTRPRDPVVVDWVANVETPEYMIESKPVVFAYVTAEMPAVGYAL